MQKGKKAFVIAAAAVSFIAVAYFGFTLFFTDHFYMNTCKTVSWILPAIIA